ncbi:cyclase [Lysobacter niastensis]|uniref:Cyclase n=1 Tax=Lysobacter niastensis TaxID=380629 RepID=A0ABS0B9K9_9GAMM|nr:cyclase [Lysobacter niastensis]MBF6023805.1 cyclase [Lysobacter niastensis]
MTDKRVVFDFEIHFSNGGGLKGWDFRLDIEGDDIADDVLADYIVRDMRLLMVGSVRIDNKRIIAEAHKRERDTVAISG